MKAALLLVFLTGCASLPGVEISDEERKLCAAQGDCTVWTLEDLRAMVRHFWGEGFKAGRDTKGRL